MTISTVSMMVSIYITVIKIKIKIKIKRHHRHAPSPPHAAVLTCIVESGGGQAGVDGAKGHHLVRLAALADRQADEGVLVLRHHQHLKHLQWTRQCKLNTLGDGDGT